MLYFYSPYQRRWCAVKSYTYLQMSQFMEWLQHHSKLQPVRPLLHGHTTNKIEDFYILVIVDCVIKGQGRKCSQTRQSASCPWIWHTHTHTHPQAKGCCDLLPIWKCENSVRKFESTKQSRKQNVMTHFLLSVLDGNRSHKVSWDLHLADDTTSFWRVWEHRQRCAGCSCEMFLFAKLPGYGYHHCWWICVCICTGCLAPGNCIGWNLIILP